MSDAPPTPDRAHRIFDGLVRWRWAWLAGLLALTGVLGFFGAKVHPDFAVELLFPERDAAKEDYDRYKAIFSYDDARALVMVEAKDIWTREGLRRIYALEQDLWKLDGVNNVEGPLSIKDVVDAGNETVKIEKLMSTPELPPEVIAEKKETARTDALFRWQLSPPDASSVTVRVTLETRTAAKDHLRNQFLEDLRAAVAKHRTPEQKIVISGLPVIRSEYTEMIAGDQALTGPLSLGMILVLLYVTFRSGKAIVAAVATILVSVVWTRGAMGILGYPEQILTGLTPIVVMIISISDTVHILVHYREACARGVDHRTAIVHATADCAWPCLLTEITIAAGFLGLYAVNIILISQFGIATAAGMMLTWVANVTVLPLAIYWLHPKPAPAAAERSPAERAFARFVGWIERQVTERPGRVAACAAGILAVATGFAVKMGREYYAFDDLRPGSQMRMEIDYAEKTFGGCDPLAIFIEPAKGAPEDVPMLEPEVVRLMDRIEAKLEQLFPREVKNALSAAAYLKKAHRIFAGPEAADKDPQRLPTTKGLVAQELEFVDDGVILRDYLDFTRRTAAIYVPMPDVGSTRIQEITKALGGYLEAEERALAEKGVPVKLTITGMFKIGEDIYRTLVGGLLGSLGLAVAISLAVFSLVLQSWRLGLLALVPNLLPLVLTFGFMGLAGINLNPNTVIVFSITLVVADDDTVQFFARFKIHARALLAAEPNHPSPHLAAAIATLRDAGLPMFVTACAVAFGFATLVVSNFIGIANLGILTGVSLFAAVFGDLFITPVLLAKVRPRLGAVAGGEPCTTTT